MPAGFYKRSEQTKEVLRQRCFRWHKQPRTDKQLKASRQNGYNAGKLPKTERQLAAARIHCIELSKLPKTQKQIASAKRALQTALAVVRSPEEREIRKRRMRKLNADPEFQKRAQEAHWTDDARTAQGQISYERYHNDSDYRENLIQATIESHLRPERKEQCKQQMTTYNKSPGHRKVASKSMRRRHQQPEFHAETVRNLAIARLTMVVPKKDSKPEKRVQAELSTRGCAYTKHAPILGRPDLLLDPKIVVFCDGDHWHGYNYPDDKIIKGNRTAKCARERDMYVNAELQKQGYTVLRFWEHEIKADVVAVVDKIVAVLNGDT